MPRNGILELKLLMKILLLFSSILFHHMYFDRSIIYAKILMPGNGTLELTLSAKILLKYFFFREFLFLMMYLYRSILCRNIVSTKTVRQNTFLDYFVFVSNYQRETQYCF